MLVMSPAALREVIAEHNSIGIGLYVVVFPMILLVAKEYLLREVILDRSTIRFRNFVRYHERGYEAVKRLRLHRRGVTIPLLDGKRTYIKPWMGDLGVAGDIVIPRSKPDVEIEG
jgi:hypothetical protein